MHALYAAAIFVGSKFPRLNPPAGRLAPGVGVGRAAPAAPGVGSVNPFLDKHERCAVVKLAKRPPRFPAPSPPAALGATVIFTIGFAADVAFAVGFAAGFGVALAVTFGLGEADAASDVGIDPITRTDVANVTAPMESKVRLDFLT